MRVAQGFVCRVVERMAADEFHFKDVKLECVGEFAYLADMLKDKVESTVIALRMGMDNLEEHLRQKRLRWFRHI